MKIYTGSGDLGKTSLFSGERIAKSGLRIEAYGEIDELNSVLGMVIAELPAPLDENRRDLVRVQGDLMEIGAWLSTTPGAPAAASLPPFDPGRESFLEAAIDRMDEQLPPLRSFILPGGHQSAAWSHIARTVCRRAERRVTALLLDRPEENEAIAGPMQTYINRLSDYLFILARYCNQAVGIADTPWEQ